MTSFDILTWQYFQMWTFTAMLKNEIPIYFPLSARTFKVFIYLYQNSYRYIKVFMISSTKNIFFNLSVLLFICLLTALSFQISSDTWPFTLSQVLILFSFFLLLKDFLSAVTTGKLSPRNCRKFSNWKWLTAVPACCKSEKSR